MSEKEEIPNENGIENETNENENEEGIEVAEEPQPELSDLPGVGPVTVKKLTEAGITQLNDLITRGPMEISRLTGKDKPDCDKLVAKARVCLEKAGLIQPLFSSGTDVLKVRQTKMGILSTGTKCLDGLLSSTRTKPDGTPIGGIETGSITEVYGEFGSGKTQLCLTLAVMCQKPVEEGGLNGNVLWVDTESTFRPERVIDIVNARNFYPDITKACKDHKKKLCEECSTKNDDPEKILENITCARAIDTSTQKLIMEGAPAIIKQNNIKLIIVDSAVGLYRSEYKGTGELARRQQEISGFVHLLQRIAETYNVVALITNQVQASPMAYGDPIKPIGGNVVGHTSTYRIYLKKSGKKHVAKLEDSPQHEQSEVRYALTVAGVSDPED